MAQARSARAINRWKKNSIRSLQYGPKTRLIRGIYVICELRMTTLYASMLQKNVYNPNKLKDTVDAAGSHSKLVFFKSVFLNFTITTDLYF